VDGAVMVDLSQMKSILRMDRHNKVAMVEPGVTFAELREAAEEAGMRVLAPFYPRETKSVLGSCLEREPITIHKYHWDMSDPLMCVEVVFGSGDTFRTGSAAGPGTLEQQWAVGCAQKNPMGPGQTDFLRLIQAAQGTMGIVTWGTVKLELLPSAQESYLVAAEDLSRLLDFSYALLKFKLPDVCLILNAAALRGVMGGEGKDLPPWALIYSISGYRHFPRERLAYLKADIADMASGCGVKPRRGADGVSAQEVVDLVSGSCGDPYWKLRPKGGCQDIFFLTTLDRAPGFLQAMREVVGKHTYPEGDLGVYVQPIRQGTGCHLEFQLSYDPDNAQEVEATKALYEDASRALLDTGGFFSRPYGLWSDLAYERAPDTALALRKVKGILDPRGVMNPGKLCFGKEA
jgi:FAD/FMN-containing dehydrogenase